MLQYSLPANDYVTELNNQHMTKSTHFMMILNQILLCSSNICTKKPYSPNKKCKGCEIDQDWGVNVKNRKSKIAKIQSFWEGKNIAAYSQNEKFTLKIWQK